MQEEKYNTSEDYISFSFFFFFWVTDLVQGFQQLQQKWEKTSLKK